ncbi:unnamed protein product [Caenorhabditis auriculariae]|uniref:CWH43-like N-terminal domain-containing protein n=1 Tax=Caenorhabditis auriculariae TaxID=2777116 RepID=A0A8S1GRD7_9PELO|nr:unnamed protein product [Caenorhabditis auriculariae]
MTFRHVGVIPLLAVAFCLLAFFIGYAIALSKDHIDAWIPYISDCGALQPESSIFGQLLNIAAMFLTFTFYLAHRNIVCFYKSINVNIGGWKTFSLLLMLLGWFSALGGSMVANFPESYHLTAHTVGAFMFFIGLILYFWGQLVLAYSLRPKMVPIHLTNFRLLLTFSVSVVLIFHSVCLFVQPFVKRENGKLPDHPEWPGNIERPKSTSPYYTNHVVSALSEWILCLLLMLNILTYTFDFAMTTLHAPQLTRSGSPKDEVASDATLVHQKDNRLHHFAIDAYANTPVTALATVPDHYSETMSHRRLPRIDRIFPLGSATTAVRPPRRDELVSGTIYSPTHRF